MERFIRRWLPIGIYFSCSLILALTLTTYSSSTYPVNSQVSNLHRSIQTEISPSTISQIIQDLTSRFFSNLIGNFQSPKAIFSLIDDILKILINILKQLFSIQFDEVLRIPLILLTSNLLVGGIVASIITLINFPILFCIRLWRLTQPQIKKVPVTIYTTLEQTNICSVQTGEISVPIKVYEGDSHSISVKIQRASEVAVPEDLHQVEEGNNLVFVQTQEKKNSPELEQLLEIALLTGSSITTEDEKKQTRSLNSLIKNYIWICNFPTSSSQEIGLVFNLLPSSELEQNGVGDKIKVIELGYIRRRINIAKFLSLTKNQIWQLQIFLVVVGILINVKTIPSLLGALPAISKALGG